MDPKNIGGDNTHPLNGNGNGNGIPPPRGYALSGKIMLSAIVVLFSIVLFILFLHLYVRWHVYRRQARRQRRRSRLILAAGGDQISSGVATRGLDPAVLNSLSVAMFSPDDVTSDADVAECAVCLSEFADGEKVRVLPRCDHRFHIDCIDMWFCSHNSCPLCRSPVEIDGTPPPPPSQCADSSVSIGSSSDSDPNPNREVRIEIPSGEEESGFKSRILAIKTFFCRDSRPIRDLEGGEAAAAPSSSAAV